MDVELHELDLRYGGLRVCRRTRDARLLQSLAQHEQFEPVVVVKNDDGGFTLIDGYARVRALRDLGRDVVSAILLDLEEAQALVTTWRMEKGPRRSALEDGWLILELMDRHGWRQAEVASRLQRSKSWVSRRRGLVQDLPASVQTAVRKGHLPAHAAMKFMLPLARANVEHCEAIVAGLGKETVSVRQIERLYRGYKCTDPLGRERLSGNPRLFLQAEAAARTQSELDDHDPAKPLINDLGAIVGCARRARRRLQEGLIRELDDTRRQLVTQAKEEAEVAFTRVVECLKEQLCSNSTNEPPF